MEIDLLNKKSIKGNNILGFYLSKKGKSTVNNCLHIKMKYSHVLIREEHMENESLPGEELLDRRADTDRIPEKKKTLDVNSFL